MISAANTLHRIKDGETLESLAASYRLSSAAAILETDSNASIRSKLAENGALPTNLVVHIPPNAYDLLRQRNQELNRLKPMLLAHFDAQQQMAVADLMPALKNNVSPFCSEEVSAVLQNLEESSQVARQHAGASSAIFVDLGTAMSLTHVATRDDHALAAAATNPESGLLWAVSDYGLSVWNSLWSRDVMDSKWGSGSSETDAQAILSYMTTVRSIVMQSVDRRGRECFSSQQKLLAEA